MATVSRIVCDICNEPADHPQKRTPVTFTTEQTEGRSCNPYIEIRTMDLCSKCLDRIIKEQPLRAYGAQGRNTYCWRGME